MFMISKFYINKLPRVNPVVIANGKWRCTIRKKRRYRKNPFCGKNTGNEIVCLLLLSVAGKKGRLK